MKNLKTIIKNRYVNDYKDGLIFDDKLYRLRNRLLSGGLIRNLYIKCRMMEIGIFNNTYNNKYESNKV